VYPKLAVKKKESANFLEVSIFERSVKRVRYGELTKLIIYLSLWQPYTHVALFLRQGHPHVMQLGIILSKEIDNSGFLSCERCYHF
jgi:hypothetical protein